MTSSTKRTATASCPTCGGNRDAISGAWLRARREAAGVTLPQMAGRCRVSLSYLSDIERGKRTLWADNLSVGGARILVAYNGLRARRRK